MHYSWEIDIEREKKREKKYDVIARSLARSQASIATSCCNICCFRSDLGDCRRWKRARDGERYQSTVEKQEQKRQHLPKSIHSRFVCVFLPVHFWLTICSRDECTTVHEKVYFYIAFTCIAKRKQIWFTARKNAIIEIRASIFTTIRIGISTSNSSWSSGGGGWKARNSRFCNLEIHSFRCNAVWLESESFGVIAVCNEF